MSYFQLSTKNVYHVYHINNKLPFCLQQRNWHFTSRSVGAPTRQPTRHTWMIWTTIPPGKDRWLATPMYWFIVYHGPLLIQPPFWSCASHQLPLRGKDPIHVWGHLTINVPPATWLQECGKVVGEAMVSNVALKRITDIVFHDICFLSCGGCSKALFLPYFPTLGASSSQE